MSVEAAGIRWKLYLEWCERSDEPYQGFIAACGAARRHFQLGIVGELRESDARWKAWLLERDAEDGHTFAQPAQVHVHDHHHTLREPLPPNSPAVLEAEARVMALTDGGNDGEKQE